MLISCIGLVAWMGCQSPVQPIDSEHGQIQLAQVAEGFRWRSWVPADNPNTSYTCLEILNAQEEGEMVTVYRDSMAYRMDRRAQNAVVLNQKGTRTATLSTTHVALIEAWDDSLITWCGGGFIDFIQSPVAQQRITCGEAVDFGGRPEWNLERIFSTEMRALCIYPFGDPLGNASWSNQIPVVPILEYTERHPLGRTEWMRVFGWIAGDEWFERSTRVFGEISSRYQAIQQETFLDSIRVFAGSVEQGVWHAPSGDSFVAQLLRDAGAEYILEAEPGQGNIQLSLEQMIVKSQEADAWGLVLNYPQDRELDIAAFLELNPMNEHVLPPSRHVFVANTQTCDYFGWWVAHPDKLLENLTHLLQGREWECSCETCFKWLDT